MNTTTNYNLKKPSYTDFADIQDINDNMDIIDGKLAAPTGDGRDQTVSFTDADLDSGITNFSTFLSKIVSGMKLAKFLRDFKAGMQYVLHTGSLINGGNCTESGKYALDAAYGKTLADGIASLNSSFANMHTPVYEHDLQRSYNISAETGWKMMYICAVDGVNNLRCEAFIPSTDIDTTSRFHYLGGYLGAGNFLSASVAVSRSSVSLASLVRNGSEVSNGYIVVRMFK